MQIKSIGNKQYFVSPSGTYYGIETKQEVISLIEFAISTRCRVKIKYKDGYNDFTGYTKDGLNVRMNIGRSCGPVKVPLHLPRKHSIGGCMLSTELIEKIELL